MEKTEAAQAYGNDDLLRCRSIRLICTSSNTDKRNTGRVQGWNDTQRFYFKNSIIPPKD